MRPRRFPRRWAVLLVVLAVLLGWLLSVSRPGTRVQGCFGCRSEAGERGDGSIRVMSLNVLHGFPRFEFLADRLDIIAAEIIRLDADIVCLQEVPWTVGLGSAADYLARRTGLNHAYVRANGSRWAILFEEGEAILSRYPLRGLTHTELRPRAGLFEHRVALSATAATPWGAVRIFVTHLTHRDPGVNRSQTESLTEFVEGSGPSEMSVVAGDFNAEEGSPQIRSLSARWVDTYRAVHEDRDGFTCCADDLTLQEQPDLGKRIDYIFVIPAPDWAGAVVASERLLVEPTSTTQGWLRASDHVGLLTTIKMR